MRPEEEEEEEEMVLKEGFDNEIRLFGFAITSWPRWLILLIGVSGIFVSFLVQGTSQEGLYAKTKFRESVFFTFIQFLGYFLLTLPYFIKLITGRVKLHASFKFYAFVSFCLVCSMGLSNLSVERLSYPTAVLFKSSKLIPVMIGGFIFLKKRYNWIEVLSILLVVAGLIGISYSDKKSNNKFDLIGVLMSSVSLCFDAVASNLQEKSLSTYGAPQTEVISMMYFIGTIYLFIASLATGQFTLGIKRCCDEPIVIAYLASFAFLGSVGVQFVYLVMKAFGSLVTVMVTSTRKAFTVCLSFVLFPGKKFTLHHLVSIFGIAGGLVLNYIGKNRKKREAKSDAPPKEDTDSSFAKENEDDDEKEMLVEYRESMKNSERL